MADEFGQRIQGLHQKGDTIVSTDRHPGIFGKTNAVTPLYEYLKIDSATGNLLTTISNTAFGVTTNYEYADGTAYNGGDIGAYTLAVRKDADAALVADGQYGPLQTDELGFLKVSGTINVTQSNSAYIYNSVTLVKDIMNIVVTETPAATEYIEAVMVSGAGYCEWQLEYGLIASPIVIMKWWTTPSHPTEYIDLPDYLEVTTLQKVRVQGTNREKAASTNSDFTGHATLIRKA